MGWGNGPAALSANKHPLLMSVSQGIWTCSLGDSSITSWAKRVPLWQPFSSVVTQKAPTLPGSTFPGTTGTRICRGRIAREDQTTAGSRGCDALKRQETSEIATLAADVFGEGFGRCRSRLPLLRSRGKDAVEKQHSRRQAARSPCGADALFPPRRRRVVVLLLPRRLLPLQLWLPRSRAQSRGSSPKERGWSPTLRAVAGSLWLPRARSRSQR